MKMRCECGALLEAPEGDELVHLRSVLSFAAGLLQRFASGKATDEDYWCAGHIHGRYADDADFACFPCRCSKDGR